MRLCACASSSRVVRAVPWVFITTKPVSDAVPRGQSERKRGRGKRSALQSRPKHEKWGIRPHLFVERANHDAIGSSGAVSFCLSGLSFEGAAVIGSRGTGLSAKAHAENRRMGILRRENAPGVTHQIRRYGGNSDGDRFQSGAL